MIDDAGGHGRPIHPARTSAAAVANAFVAFAREEPQFLFDQMKLQKLLYYAHAWRLAIHGEALFDEDLEAWPWGPVVRDIYNQTAGLGRGRIDQTFLHLSAADFALMEPKQPDDEILGFLRDVWDSHKRFTGIQLSNSTHAPGEPWAIVKRGYGSLAGKPTIPNDLIQRVFLEKLANEPAHDPAA